MTPGAQSRDDTRPVSLSCSCCQNLARRTALCRHTRSLQIVRRPLASWIAPFTVWWIRRLPLPRKRQCRGEPLILDDRAGRHRLDVVEHLEWHCVADAWDLQPVAQRGPLTAEVELRRRISERKSTKSSTSR